MVWMFALKIFWYSNSEVAGSPSVSSVILYVISGGSLCQTFRSRPIMMSDVLAVKTAMTVAGSYNYTPTFMDDHLVDLPDQGNVLAQLVPRIRGKKRAAGGSAAAVAVFIGGFYTVLVPKLGLEVIPWDPTTSMRGERLCAGVGGILKISGKESSGGLFPGEDPGDL
ncbi:MAG: hypothetical protein ACLUAR_17920 [Pilosibacter sp.]